METSSHTVFKSMAVGDTKSKKESLALSFFQTLSATTESFIGFTPSEDLLENFTTSSFAPPLSSTSSKWHHGLSQMVFMNWSHLETAQQCQTHDLMSHHQGQLQLLFADAKKLKSGPPATPTSLDGLLFVLHRQYGFLSLVWGPSIHLSIATGDIRHHLLSKQNCFINVDGFIWHQIPTIIWEIALATTTFFETICTAQHFDDADIQQLNPRRW
jgi:hypothetical protein